MQASDSTSQGLNDVSALRAVIGGFLEWLEPQKYWSSIDQSRTDDKSAYHWIQVAVDSAVGWLDQLEQGKQNAEARRLLAIASVCEVLNTTALLPGGERRIKRLRSLLRSRAFDAFEDLLFESEVALHWLELEGYVRGVEFPVEHHPDLWMHLLTTSGMHEVPIECKRLNRSTVADMTVGHITSRLHEMLESRLGKDSAFRFIVWLHTTPDAVDLDEIVGVASHLARQIMERELPGNKWLSDSTREGQAQVSVASLAEYSALEKRQIAVTDMPVGVPALNMIVRAELIHDGTQNPPIAARIVLAVRSDVLPPLIGALERNLFKAIGQLEKSAKSNPGIVAIRMPSHRGLGDLYESDQIIRRVLRERDLNHVALVVLYWIAENEMSSPSEDGSVHRSTVERLLDAHFVSNPSAVCSWETPDDFQDRFGNIDGTPLRDVESGSLVPFPREYFDAIERTDSLEVPIDFVGLIKLQLELSEPLPPADDLGIIGIVRVQERALVVALGKDENLWITEIHQQLPTRSAVIDLRAFRGMRQFRFGILLQPDGWAAMIKSADGETKVLASSVRLRPTYF